MRSKAFRLAPVLRIRQMQERVAAGQAAVAQAAVRAAEAEQAALTTQAAHVTVPSTAQAGEFVRALTRGQRLAADAAQAGEILADRVTEAEAARSEWTAAARATKVMEKLRDRHVEAVNSAREHAEISAVDDLVTRAYAVRSQSEGHL